MRAAVFRGAFDIRVEQIPEDRSRWGACFLPISACVEGWLQRAPICQNCSTRSLRVGSIPRPFWISRSAWTRSPLVMQRWISDRQLK